MKTKYTESKLVTTVEPASITLTLTEEELVALGTVLYKIGGTFGDGKYYADLYEDLVANVPLDTVDRMITREGCYPLVSRDAFPSW